MRIRSFAAMIAPVMMALPVAAGADTANTVVPDGTVLNVNATGRVVRTPDIATIRAGVVTQGTTAAAALTDNANRMAGVVRALKAAGIADRDIATSNVSLSPQYRYADNQPPVITGYQATNSVSVKFRDIAKSGAALDALVKSGANQIDGPAMSLSNPDAALDAARQDAVARARARADLYARAAGMQVARIVSIDESGENAGDTPRPPVMYRAMASMAKDEATSIMPGETDVTVNLSVRFLLK